VAAEMKESTDGPRKILNDNSAPSTSENDGEVGLDTPMNGVGPSLPYPVKAFVTRARSALWLARSRGCAAQDGMRILFYHRVSDDRDELSVHPRKFREQMEYLAEAGYRVLDIVQVADLLDAGETPERIVGLNFDDGYRDVSEQALPILAEYGFRATVFIATGVTDGRARFAWYRERQPPLLDWAEIAELDRGGTLEFEAHSVTHPNLLAVDEERAAAEIEDSKRELEARLDRPVTALSYPAGLFGQRERGLAAKAGYRIAVSCEPGVNLPDTDRFALRRRQIDARDRLLDFRAKVSGGHDTPLPLRGVYRRLRYGEGRGSPLAASVRR
jgi:peptidoglycan/xylan/chitin deacetylase (PgdA/CDA1 family)